MAMLGGKPVIARVLERVAQSGLDAVVATDDARILECVHAHGGQAVMTRSDHKCGTDRIREAMEAVCPQTDVVINVQGDEPFIHPEQILSLLELFEKYPDTQIATLVRPLPSDTPYERLSDPALVKAIMGAENRAIYFSRFPVPYMRGVPEEQWASKHKYLAHIGIYAYRGDVLRQVTEMPASSLEQAESLEQLRWLQAGYTIRMAISEHETIGIDTPQDLARAEEYLAAQSE